MTRHSMLTICPPLATLVAALVIGGASAQTSGTITFVPRNAGPVNVSDLRVLLGEVVNFELFDFESSEDFCLQMGYVYEVDDVRVEGADGGKACHLAGRHRLIVAIRPIEDARVITVGLHELETGMGGSVNSGTVQIGEDISGGSLYRPEQTLSPDQEVTLLRWSYGDQRPGHGPKHDIHITVRLGANPDARIAFESRG